MKKLCHQKNQHINLSGVTLPELILVMSIFAALIAIATINLASIKNKASLNTSITTLISDLKQQQLKAMVGDTEGRGVTDSYGLYLGQNQYILFHGTYNPSDPSNFTVNLDDNLQFPNPGTSVIFASGSGEFTAPTSLILQDTQTNEQKTIQINTLGTVTGVN